MRSIKSFIWLIPSLIILSIAFGFPARATASSSYVESISCPLYSPPPPGWCDDGQVVSGGTNANGCPLPPSCVRENDSSESESTAGEDCSADHPCETKTLKVEEAEGSTTVFDGDLQVRSTVPVKVEESQVKTVVNGKKEMVILPSQVKKMVETEITGAKLVPEESKIQKIELSTCTSAVSGDANCKGNTSVYETSVERVDKLFGLFPVKSQVSYKVGASNGQVLSV